MNILTPIHAASLVEQNIAEAIADDIGDLVDKTAPAFNSSRAQLLGRTICSLIARLHALDRPATEQLLLSYLDLIAPQSCLTHETLTQAFDGALDDLARAEARKAAGDPA
ncbi:hypothetical protein [Oceaniovalibus sp. ACAM 378]|uniref:hypothetical protein n=1 Tax=Oceaniovalibus sp. ACAM 378 TaxID=2599923 RepID=UPI0011D42203|nr:hypothetical protein [Oceaniovalibus sp. ACAM 378]TYB85841.1 hypothetical protein FQ320_18485 [Oceaniovalibus sp. ACAM 378]